MNKNDRRLLITSWLLLVVLMVLCFGWAQYQVKNLRQLVATTTSKLESLKPTTVTQRFKLIAGKDGENGTNGTDSVSTNTVEVQTVTIPGRDGIDGQNGKDGANGRSARSVEFCKFADGSYGQRYVGDEDCNPIETVE